MADEQKKIVPINYTNRDFRSIRQDLMQIAERLYPGKFQDFSEASFGSLMLDAVAYVHAQTSFYLDYNINETFLDTANQYSNVLRHGRILGYKNTGSPSTYGQVSLFILVPASTTGLGPDTAYLPLLKRGSKFTSTSGQNYVLTDNVDFAASSNPVVVGRVSAATGAPTYFAIKAYGTVVSGFFGQQRIKVGAYERFKKVVIPNSNIAEIISVVDTEGNEYFEVDYLSQDMVFKEFPNTNYKADNIPSIIKPWLVSRKFVISRNRNYTILQFGSGEANTSNVAADPQAYALEIFGKNYVTDTTFDPTRLSKNENFGIVPSNTTLTIKYRATNATNNNIGAGSLTTVSAPVVQFTEQQSLNSSTVTEIISSLEVINELPIVGNVTTPNTEELKRRIYDTFPTQNRAVTQADYENLAYRMPAKFGSIKRCSVQKDPDSLKRNLNMYVISEDEFGKLAKSNSTIKNNLKTWLNQYRMLNDTVDILDAYIINFGISFIIKAATGVNKFTLVDECIALLAKKYGTNFYIGEPVYISDIYRELKTVTGVLDVERVRLTSKTGGNYSSVQFDINSNLSPDGSYVIVPKNAVLELKYGETDITGKVK